MTRGMTPEDFPEARIKSFEKAVWSAWAPMGLA